MNMSSVAEPGRKPAASTNRLLWWGSLSLLLTVVVLRIPRLSEHVTQLLQQDHAVAAELTDESLRRLAIGVGIALAIGLTAIIAFTYQSLGRALERHVFRPSLSLVGKQRAGLFFLTFAACTVPVQMYCLVTGHLSVKSSAGYYIYVVAVSVLAIFIFRRSLATVSKSRQILLFGVTLGYGLLSAAL